MRDAGYATYLLGYSHECQSPAREGFNEVLGGPDENRVRDLRRVLNGSTDREQPFFITITTQAVHRPFGDAHSEEIAEQLAPPPWMPDSEEARIDLACFHRYVSEADAQLGDILQALEDADHRDDTIFIFTSDHGAAFARAKHSLYDPGLRIACIVRWPEHIEAGLRIPALLSNLDFSPTVRELAGLTPAPTDAALHGWSFADLLTGSGASRRERSEVFAEHTYGIMYWPTRCIRTERYKYICNFEPLQPIMHEAFLVSRFGEEVVNEHYSAPAPPEELYDLEKDPHEFCNLANDPRHGHIRRDLRRRLFDFLRSTGDSLLDGPVPDPSGDHTEDRTFEKMWSADEDGLYRTDLPPHWRPDTLPSRS
jgi:arylsulfatase A-like enzyme